MKIGIGFVGLKFLKLIERYIVTNSLWEKQEKLYLLYYLFFH